MQLHGVRTQHGGERHPEKATLSALRFPASAALRKILLLKPLCFQCLGMTAVHYGWLSWRWPCGSWWETELHWPYCIWGPGQGRLRSHLKKRRSHSWQFMGLWGCAWLLSLRLLGDQDSKVAQWATQTLELLSEVGVSHTHMHSLSFSFERSSQKKKKKGNDTIPIDGHLLTIFFSSSHLYAVLYYRNTTLVLFLPSTFLE